MTGDEVKERIEAIRATAQRHDEEVTHFMEDTLYEDALRAIADGADNAHELAAETLKVLDLGLGRWYA